MPGEFEKNIQQRMRDFKLTPSPQVWGEIDAALNEKKRRRFALWWWLLPALLVTGAGVWLYNNAGKPGKKQATAQQKDIQQAVTSQSADTGYHLTGAGNETPATNETAESGSHVETKADAAKPATSAKPIRKVYRRQQTATGNLLQPATGSQQTTANNLQLVTGNQQLSASSAGGNKEGAVVAGNTDQAIEKSLMQQAVDSSSNDRTSLAENEVVPATTNKTGAATAQATTPKTIKASNKGNFYIQAGGGAFRTVTVTGSSRPLAQSLYDAIYAPSNGNVVIAPAPQDSAYSIVQPSAGYHMNVTLQYNHVINKRWKLSAGIGYRYLSNTQKTGRIIDSVQGLQYAGSFNSRKNAEVEGYSYAGFSNTSVNRAHWLEVPVMIQYYIKPSAKRKIFIEAGVSYAWMFSSRWLIPDAEINRLYYSNQLLNRNIFSWQAGAGLELANRWKLGLLYQQSISTLADRTIKPGLHWQNLSLQLSAPLTHGKRSK
ncbi:porin family protein [Foetidibacter luteolus]|uniref:porin family protein n=1 Tax=Foetidibacter luteolus TaxID=2608880 RepID=UPI00129A6573|nr:porin family protein [Foetidibacter luteolus]